MCYIPFMIKQALRPSSSALDAIWLRLREEATAAAAREPGIANYIRETVTSAAGFDQALGHVLAGKLADGMLDRKHIYEVFAASRADGLALDEAACRDLAAILERDPAAPDALTPFLFFKGFHALQTYRLAHWLWQKDRKMMALALQSKGSSIFAVDIHPAARIGAGILLDHATSVVIGETAVVEDDVSMLHDVTLGGTGKHAGDRHPKVRTGVLIGAGAKILGNIEIGTGALVAAGSVVLKDVPPHTTVAGVPAKVVGAAGPSPARDMDQALDYGASI